MNEYLPTIDYTVASVVVFGVVICAVAYNCIDEVKHIWQVKKIIK